MKIHFGSLLSLLISVAAALLIVVSADAKGEPAIFKVGVILPLSGEVASVGEAIKNGITMGLEELPGKTRARLKLIYEDDGMNPKNTISAYNKLLALHRIGAVVNASSGTSKALAPLADVNKTPFIAIATDPAVVQGKRYAVNFWVTAETESAVMLKEIARRGYKCIARISTIQDAMLSLKEAFDSINNGQVKIVLDEEYPAEVKDFKSFLTKVRAKKDLDGILMHLMPGHLGVFAKQARQMGVEAPLFGFESLEDSAEVQVSEGALLGAWYVNSDDPNTSFIDKYKKRFPRASLFGASNGHDLVLLLGKAVEKSTDPEDVNRYLHEVRDFKGALGTYSASGDNRFTLPAAVKVVSKDGFAKLSMQD